MYSYGWRDYMPDIARWNGIDQLAENYLSTSTYAYVANNPVSYADVDGRWFNEDGTIDLSGHTPGFTTGHQYQTSFLGQYPGQGGGAGGGYTFTGNAAGSMFNYFANGGSIDGISFNNGKASWWTNTTEDAGILTNHIWKFTQGSIWDSIGDFFQDHFVLKTELSGSIGVQVGAKLGGSLQANAEAGILSTDIGKLGWSYNDGFYAKYGDGKGHNFAAVGIKILSKQLSVGGKLDYVTNDAIPTAGDLLEYSPNNGHLEWEANLGPGNSHWSPQKGSDADILNVGLKSKLRGSNKESCTYCADLGIGFKALLGVDLKLIIGFK